MEKAREPQPRTANNRLRQIITILLLLGGVFVLGLIWTIRYYHFYVDRVTPYVPESANFVMTVPINESSLPLWKAFNGEFARAFSSIQYEVGKTIVLFVYKDVANDEIRWQIMTDATIDELMVPDTYLFSRYRHLSLISSSEPLINDVSEWRKPSMNFVRLGTGFGYITEELLSSSISSSRLPIHLSLTDSSLKLVLGYRMRGPRGVKEFPIHARQITFLPDDTAAYAYIPAGKSPQLPAGFKLDSFINTLIKGSGFASEIVLSKTSEYATLLHTNEKELRIEVIEQPIIEFLSQLEPVEETVWLADGTHRIELRLNRGEVSLEERMIPGEILVRKHISEDGRSVSIILYPDGRVWITNNLMFLTSLLISDVSWDAIDIDCQPNASAPGMVFTNTHVKDSLLINDSIDQLFSNFKVNSLRLESSESNLYTFCGYFSHNGDK